MLWVIWTAMFGGLFVMFHVLGGSRSAVGDGSDSALWVLGIIPFVVATLIRWLVVPRLAGLQAGAPVFVVGLATAELTLFPGLFLFSDHDVELLIFATLGVLQVIPLFTDRLEPASPKMRPGNDDLPTR